LDAVAYQIPELANIELTRAQSAIGPQRSWRRADGFIYCLGVAFNDLLCAFISQ
jgi:hypothetical protein